jgi:uncharacterized membrane protein YphA (DoxX/SURF4 family)
MSIDPVIVLIVRFGVAWLFLASALHKLRDFGDFRAVLASYGMLPERAVDAAAPIIVAVETATAVGALAQYRPAYAGAAVVLFTYAAVMTVNLLRGRRFIDCGCGGAAQPLSVGLVIRNVVLSLGALIALLPTLARPLGWIDIVSVVIGSAVLGTLYAATNQLLAARARLEEWV